MMNAWFDPKHRPFVLGRALPTMLVGARRILRPGWLLEEPLENRE